MKEYQVLVHYHRKDGLYTGYQAWQWQSGEEGQPVAFEERTDHFGFKARLSFKSSSPLTHAHFLFKKWDWEDQTRDFTVKLLPDHLLTEVWVLEGDDQLYYSYQAAVHSRFYADYQRASFDVALKTEKFDRKWGYQGWLGARHEKGQVTFKVWAPTAKKVRVLLYDGCQNTSPLVLVYDMKPGFASLEEDHRYNTIGVWSCVIQGDLAGKAYQYEVEFENCEFTSRDPYSKAATADGKRSVILDQAEGQVEGFKVAQGAEAPWRLTNPCQAVIYEMHVRDLTKSESSGVAENLRGTFLGACQTDTKNSAGQPTGFDYIKSLGVNVVQLQPVSDRHKDYEADGSVTYNWGYDPQNYNVVESSLSSNPTDPAQVIRDFKTMVQAYHDAGISVTLDVVYNHIYSTFDSPFEALVPGYYYRMNPDGSFQDGTGVGSETASEHEMFRKYMIDSLLYWVKEYNVDGFRFDLMGIHDVETMRQIRAALDEVDPRILTYGEGWDMGQGLLPEDKAKKDNAPLLSNIGFFNDNERDAIKGAEIYGELKTGFVSGAATEEAVAQSILGSRAFVPYLAPNQVLNYVEAHDNYNLHDLLQTLHPTDDELTLTKRIELATAINLLMQGMAFMELGQEFSRSKLVATGENGELTQLDKERAMNSYNAPDRVNQVDWNRVGKHQESIDFIRQIIALKTKIPAFSYQTYEEIEEHVKIVSAESGTGLVVFEILDDKHYLILFNAGPESCRLENRDKFKCLATNNRSQDLTNLEPLTASVFELL